MILVPRCRCGGKAYITKVIVQRFGAPWFSVNCNACTRSLPGFRTSEQKAVQDWEVYNG